MLDKFHSFSIPSIKDAKTLAIELAKRTRFLRDEVIDEELRYNSGDSTSPLQAFLKLSKIN